MLWTPVLLLVGWVSGVTSFALRGGSGQRAYYATCSQGLIGALEAELSAAPINAVKIVPG